ncbi:MAG: translocation/assembly module TamB domain-containing protein [Bacteroidota bacterium]|nr:translocation/assembly module TamB domain-containing protein [Bacteroidota bacterium]
MRSLPARIVRLFALAGAVLVVLLLLLVAFAQTKVFRDLLRQEIAKAVDSSMYARLQIGAIEGGVFTGFTLRDVSFIPASGPLLSVPRVTVRYNPLSLLWKEIRLTEITLHEPRITITRGAVGRWNIEGLSRDTIPPPPSEKPFDWRIIVRSLAVENASVSVWDSLSTPTGGAGRFDASHIAVSGVGIRLSADIAPEAKRVAIADLHLRNDLGPVHVESLSGDFRVSKKGGRIDRLALRTSRSRLLLSTALKGADPLADTTFRAISKREMEADLSAASIDMRDLEYFLPALDFFGASVPIAMGLRARGTLEKLVVERLDVSASQTQLSFAGVVEHIAGGGELAIDVSTPASTVHGADVRAVLPGLSLPDLSGLGEVRFSVLRYVGTPARFRAELEMESDAGALKVSGGIDFRPAAAVYDFDASVRRLDLSRVLGDAALSSSLTLRARAHGRGFAFGTMEADADITADTVRFTHYRADSLSLSARVRTDSIALDGALRLGGGSLGVSSRFRIRDGGVGPFALDLHARSLDLAKVLNDEAYHSNVTLRLEASGDGVSLSRNSLAARLELAPSMFAGYTLDRDTVTLRLDQRDPAHRAFTLTTRYLSAAFRGTFDLPRFAADLAEQADSIAGALRSFRPTAAQARSAVTSRRLPLERVRPAPPRAGTDTASYMDASFAVEIRDTDPLRRALGADLAFLRGNLEGHIAGGRAGFDIGANIRVPDLYFVDSSNSLIAAGVRCEFSARNLRADDPLRRLVLDARAGVQELGLKDLRFRNLTAAVSFADGVPRFAFGGLFDTLLHVSLAGEAAADGQRALVSLRSARFSYRGFSWTNDDTIRIGIDDSAVVIGSCAFVRNGTRVEVGGTRTWNGTNDLRLSVERFHLSGIDTLLGRGGEETGAGFTGTASLLVDVRGTDEDPVLAMDMFIDRPGYDEFRFERFTLEATYRAQMLELYSELFVPVSADAGNLTKRRVLFASGTLPVHLSFAAGRPVRVTGEAHLRATLQRFPLALLETVGAVFSPFEGMADAEIDIAGPADGLRYNGSLTVADARGKLVYNNMWYRIALDVRPEGDTIFVRRVSLRNESSDLRDGELSARGAIVMRGFSVESVEAEVAGKLKILRRESRSILRGLLGDLIVSTGPVPLRFVTRPGQAELGGSVRVLEGSLTYEGAEGVGADTHPEIRYVLVDDTRKEKQASLSAGGRAAAGSLMGRKLAAADTARRGNGSAGHGSGMRYDIAVSTDGPLRVVMPFSTISQIELDARLNIDDLHVTNVVGPGKFAGSVSLAPESYFLMLGKRFTADGTINFLGDPSNPDLNLRAVYSDFHDDPQGETRRKVFVIITITGTREKPVLAWDMRWDSPESQSRPIAGDVQSDAFSFIITGLFTDELTSGDRSRIVDQTDAIVSAMASSIISSTASEFLAKAGLQKFFHRIEVGSLNSRDVRLKVTGGIGRVLATYDGKINNLGSSEITFEIPMSMFFSRFGFGNMVIQASRRTTGAAVETSASVPETAVYELKLLYRLSF